MAHQERYGGNARGVLFRNSYPELQEILGRMHMVFGGIGATPDDRTREAAGAALGVELALHPEAEAEIRARFGDEITAERLQMGVYPLGSEIVPNTYNRIPGFSIREHYNFSIILICILHQSNLIAQLFY